MLSLLSFLNKPLLSFCEKLTDYVPGIEKAVCLSFNPQTKIFEAHLLPYALGLKSSYTQEAIEKIKDELRTSFEKKRASEITEGWYTESQLFSEQPFKGDAQLLLCDDEATEKPLANVLLLSLKNAYDKKNDFIILFFKSYKKHIVIDSNNYLMNDTEKLLVKKFIKTSVKITNDIEFKNREAFKDIQAAFKNVMAESEQWKRRLEHTRSKLGKSYIELAKSYIKKLAYESREDFEFIFEDAAIQKISEFKGSHEALEHALRRTFNVMRQIYDKQSENAPMTIPGSLINFEYVSEQHKEDLKQTGIREIDYDVYHKTFQMLDKYEEAVKKLVEKGKKITITHIGNQCKRKITAAAVSDSITKHAGRIKALFRKYPERWPLIKEKLGPVKNKIIRDNFSNLD